MKRIAKSFIAKAHRFGLPLPSQIAQRAENFSAYQRAQEMARELFESKSLKYNEAGYWTIDPMPSQVELDHYYSTAYWATRDDRKVLVKDRDIAHVNLLLEVDRDLFLSSGPKTAVNFGAGHGGASFLFRAQGFKVINVDPYPGDIEFFEYRSALSQIDEPVDLFYASHSLEHVTDIEDTVSQITRLIRPGGMIFIEVPNADFVGAQMNPEGGSSRPRIQPPHTYYFTSKFFRQFDFTEVGIQPCSYSKGRWGAADSFGESDVLRYIGTA
jgi:predicted SAM-dependent methyltransferase